MCFGGGGQQQAAAPQVSVTPTAPVMVQPQAPAQLTQEYKPLQPTEYQPGIQQAGASRRRRNLASGRQTMARRRGLSIGVSGAASAPPSGGINL